jgi:hypothetical protein
MPSTCVTGMCYGCSWWTCTRHSNSIAVCMFVCVCACVCLCVGGRAHNGWWIMILQHSILHSRVGPVWVTVSMFYCQTQQTFIKFISDCYMFWSYRLSLGNIIHNLKHKYMCMGMLEICKMLQIFTFLPTPDWHSTHTYIANYVFCCMIMVSKTKKHVAITDDFFLF